MTNNDAKKCFVAYGISDKSDNKISNLFEVTIKADPATLRELASFFCFCAEKLESAESSDWDHEHFSHLNKQYENAELDVVIVNHLKY